MKTAEGLTQSTMDKLDYGLSEPQMVLLKDGSVFIAGQYQAPMDPPVVNNPQTQGMRVMAADTVSILGGTGIFRTGSFAPGFGPLFMNQGVDRMVATQNDETFDGTTIVGDAWRGGVPRICGRNTLLHGTISSTFPISSSDAAKLRVDVYVDDMSTPFISDLTLMKESSPAVPAPWFKQNQWGYSFVVPSTKARLGAAIKLKLKDPSGTLLAAGNWQEKMLSYTPTDAMGNPQSPWVDQPKGIQVILMPVTIQYEDPSKPAGSQTITYPITNLTTYQTQLDAVLRKIYPYSDGGITYDLNTKNVSVIWDLGTKNSNGTFTPNVGTPNMVPLVTPGPPSSPYKPWDDLANYTFNKVVSLYGPMDPQEAGVFICALVPPISNITQSASMPRGYTHPMTTTSLNISHFFAVLDPDAIDGAHELGHGHQLGHTFIPFPGPYWSWPTDGIYNDTPTMEGGSKIGVLAWDPFYMDGATDPLHCLLNSGSVSDPLWGFKAYDPCSGAGYLGRAIDLMDYINRNTDQRYWISDYTFAAIFGYNMASNQ